MVGFAFAGAASRFTNRLDLIVNEANALGTAYLRADTIAEPQRGELKAALREYSADRVTGSHCSAAKDATKLSLYFPR